jgi:hypothetical protein
MVIHEYEVPEGVLTQVLPTYSDHGHHGNLPLQGKIPIIEPGIEPGTSGPVVRRDGRLGLRLRG